jgi:hypothetical protein
MPEFAFVIPNGARLQEVAGLADTGKLIGGRVARWRPMEIFLCAWDKENAHSSPLRKLGKIPKAGAFAYHAGPLIVVSFRDQLYHK